MKKIIPILILLALLFGFVIGLIIYKANNFDNGNIINVGEKQEETLIDDECTKWEEEQSLNANSIENKVSPKAKLIFKILYKQCNHLKEIKEEINNEELINLTEEEFKRKYPDWQIQRFTPNEIIIYKEINDYCDEHFKIKEENGNITVYKIDKSGKESLEKTTDISISYLENQDIEKLKNGIMVYSKKELNKKLEDFE